jgi:hypothetical protein
VNRAWYRIAFARADAPSVFVVAPGEHLGEAIATAASRLRGAWPIGVAPASPDEVPLGESVGKGVVVDRGAAFDLPPTMRPPAGVVASLSNPPHKIGELREGWVEHRDDHLLVIEAQVAGDRLTDVFLGLVEQLPSADNLEIKIAEHHDGGVAGEQVWLSPRIDVRRAIRLLDDHDAEWIDDGHVELSIYVRKEHSTLRLAEHRTIVWLSDDRSTRDRFAGWLAAANVPAATQLTRIADLAHFHYRGPRTHARPKLAAKLKSMQMRRVDQSSASKSPSEARDPRGDGGTV